MEFTAWILVLTYFTKPTTFTLKLKIMSRQNRNTGRDSKSVDTKRDVANGNDHYPRNNREESRNEQDRSEVSHTSELDRYRLNDLYERSSI